MFQILTMQFQMTDAGNQTITLDSFSTSDCTGSAYSQNLTLDVCDDVTGIKITKLSELDTCGFEPTSAKKKSNTMIIGAGVAGFFGVALLVGVVYYVIKKRNARKRGAVYDALVNGDDSDI